MQLGFHLVTKLYLYNMLVTSKSSDPVFQKISDPDMIVYPSLYSRKTDSHARYPAQKSLSLPRSTWVFRGSPGRSPAFWIAIMEFLRADRTEFDHCNREKRVNSITGTICKQRKKRFLLVPSF
jgi:hypothetical protein